MNRFPDSNQTKSLLAKEKPRACVVSWVAVLLMAALIFWMSAKSGATINEGLGIISSLKAFLTQSITSLFGYAVDVSPLGHFAEYFLFGILLYNALRFHLTPRQALVIALFVGSLYGITDEIHQLSVPDRTCDVVDWLVDTIAVALGAALTKFFLRNQAHSSTRSKR